MNIPTRDLLIILGLWFFLGVIAGTYIGHFLADHDHEPAHRTTHPARRAHRAPIRQRTHLRVITGDGSQACSLYDYENDPPWGAA